MSYILLYALDPDLYPDAQRNTGRRRDYVAQTALARGSAPQADRRTLHLPAAGCARAAQGRTHRPRRNGPRRGDGSFDAGASTAGNLAAERTLPDRQRRVVPVARPRQTRMAARPHP